MEAKSRVNNCIKKEDFSLVEENTALKSTLSYFKEELDRLRKPPLVVCDVVKVIDDKAIIRLANSNNFLVNISKELIGKIKPGDKALAEQKSLSLIDRLGTSKKFSVEEFLIVEKPNIDWQEIGGLKEQIREIKEVIELPMNNPELFKNIGIDPPKGILLYGPSGTGKTRLAKAVASSTKATFIEIIGSELVQKFIGEGAKLVKDIFKLAKEKAPSIIFIDELDSIATTRMDIGTSGEREVQRTFMQLLAEIDGFENLADVKIIGATNRVDIIDNAILRPGRLDRLINVTLPDINGREEIFKIHTKNMNPDKIDLKKLAELTEGFSGARIKAVCTEAGYFAIRNNRYKTNLSDFLEAIKKISIEKDDGYLEMFG